MLYYNLSTYLRERFGKRLRKICIDGGFTCPNRDGKCGTGGCIYCGEHGAGEHIDKTKSIAEQVTAQVSSAKPDEEFILYFQSFTNTYAPVSVLRERYDAALIDERIRVLAIGTRPDCIDEETVKLLAEYNEKYEVWVELGLQTANDKTADIINRGYHRDAFERAMDLLSRYGIKVVVHIIIGLPTESAKEVRESADYLSRFDLFGIKIHSIYVMEGTALADMYRKKRYTPPTLEEYIDSTIYVITHTNKNTVIHRLTGDCPKDMLIAPDWNFDKNAIIDAICKKMTALGLKQGDFFLSSHKGIELTSLTAN